MKSPRVLLVIPCYNEQQSISGVLKEISELDQGFHVLVIDDGSNDDTFLIANASSPVVHLLRNLGIGAAVQTGIKYAERYDFDFCVQIDGDGQHRPDQVGKLLKVYIKTPAEIVVGSRFLTNDSYRSTWSRRLGAKIIARALNLFADCNISDPTSGMRLLDRRAIRFFARHYPYDFPEPISLAWALKAGMTVREAAVEMRARGHGRSSIAGIKSVAYMFRVVAYIFLARLKRSSFL